MATTDELFDAWHRDLSGWGIPDEILAAAPEPPWGFPHRVFAQRAHQQVISREGPSYLRAREALPEGGSVLDVGSGAGAASLPLANRAARITAVDSDPQMLESLRSVAAANPETRAEIVAVVGKWPDVAPEVEPADVVCCHHVLYNVQDLRPFAEALHAHARRRVVCELTDEHPLEPMNPLWRQFHNLERPPGPSAGNAAAALRSLGYDVTLETRDSAPLHRYESLEEMVTFHRKRLCLPASRDPEVADALIALGVDPEEPVGLGAGRPLVTLWWDAGPSQQASR